MTTENKLALAAIVVSAITQVTAALLPVLTKPRKNQPRPKASNSALKAELTRLTSQRFLVTGMMVAQMIFGLFMVRWGFSRAKQATDGWAIFLIAWGLTSQMYGLLFLFILEILRRINRSL
jgi:hypothetical protein